MLEAVLRCQVHVRDGSIKICHFQGQVSLRRHISATGATKNCAHYVDNLLPHPPLPCSYWGYSIVENVAVPGRK